MFLVYLLCVSILNVKGFNIEQQLTKEISEESAYNEFFGYTFAIKGPSSKTNSTAR